jgi:glutaredoxin
MQFKHVEGENKGKVVVFALSTCGWCKKTKALLEELNIGFDYAYIDQLSAQEKEEALDIVRKWNPACSFPSTVINDQQCIVGFNEPKIREAFGK